ncbi:hypothetical protein [Acidovorax sp. SUPP2825]|uniref:hypothetical protein n=1 Tax=Acidovorax sp. SUPP2825 TaxID=2920879 RepID=UPI0023DE3DE3|nr:hypothetical protein [Acidovorax sp. SUPP2825]GKS96916.1 hypothetical protein AVAK2825_20295 [Acidovorax sp. SUPP2825]
MNRPRYRIPAPARRAHIDTFRKAQLRATRLTEAEISEIMSVIRQCAARLREGVATELQVELLRSTMLIAHQIEHLGYLRGMSGHIEAAMLALSTVHDRASSTGAWTPVQLHLQEMDAINCMVDLHDHQLRQLSFAELQQATNRVIAQMRSQGGGSVVQVDPADLELGVFP